MRDADKELMAESTTESMINLTYSFDPNKDTSVWAQRKKEVDKIKEQHLKMKSNVMGSFVSPNALARKRRSSDAKAQRMGRRGSITGTPPNASKPKEILLDEMIVKKNEVKRATTVVTGSKRGAFGALELEGDNSSNSLATSESQKSSNSSKQ
jgi:hypothetical protein